MKTGLTRTMNLECRTTFDTATIYVTIRTVVDDGHPNGHQTLESWRKYWEDLANNMHLKLVVKDVSERPKYLTVHGSK